MTNLIKKYGIEVGQIYFRADGANAGCVVVDTTTYEDCDDVVVQYFSNNGFSHTGRIDAFKLAMVRYYCVS